MHNEKCVEKGVKKADRLSIVQAPLYYVPRNPGQPELGTGTSCTPILKEVKNIGKEEARNGGKNRERYTTCSP